MTDSTLMNQQERLLEPFIVSVRRDADNVDIAAATERFRSGLPAEDRALATRGWLPKFATLAAVFALFATGLPFILPGTAGNAFADVQQWFSNYDTLEVRTSMVFGDKVMVDMRVQTTARGDVRIEQAGITHILNASQKTFSTLLPEQRYTSNPITVATSAREGLEWVDKLTAFRGDAIAIDAERTIDGKTAIGHRLVIDGVDLTLWSRKANDQPILLEGDLPGGLRLETHFTFDVSISASQFDIPSNYSPL